jgi:hypothetical protein
VARRKDSLPLPVVRDLLGITRALYRAEHARAQPDIAVLQKLERIGELLRLALDLGQGRPDTLGMRAAWNWAEQACEALGAVVADLELEPAVRATIERLER